jgi:hypothetical protein
MLNRILEYVSGPTFGSRMQAVVAETGWRPVSRSARAVAFELTYGGHDYTVLTQADGNWVKVVAWSNARFAVNRFPPALAAVLGRRNGQLEKFDWKQYDGERASWPVLVTSVRLAALDGEMMRFAVNAMLAEVETLDDGLREQGVM